MSLSISSRNVKRLLAVGGTLLVGGGGVLLLVRYGFIAFVLGILLWYMPKDNTVPAGQLTVVQGTVTNAHTGRPIAGVLLSVTASMPHTGEYRATSDSVRTDAQGKYSLRFRNEKGRYYRVFFDVQERDDSSDDARYRFAEADYQSLSDPGSGDNLSATERNLTLGTTNTINFSPNERCIVALRVHNRHTGYYFWQLPDGYRELTSDRDTTVYLSFYPLPAAGIKIRYSNNENEGAARDTVVAVVLHNPAALFPDTVRATLTLVQ